MPDPASPAPEKAPTTSTPALAAAVDFLWARPGATLSDLQSVCREATKLGIHGIALPGSFVSAARHLIEESNIAVIALAGWPWGVNDTDVKRYEVETAIDQGAQEVEVVIDPGRVKVWHRGGEELRREIMDLIEAADERPLRIVAECSLLTPFQLQTLSLLALECGAAGFQPGSGLIDRLPPHETIEMLVKIAEPRFKLKIPAGIRSHESARELLAMGVSRIGSASLSMLMEPVRDTPSAN